MKRGPTIAIGVLLVGAATGTGLLLAYDPSVMDAFAYSKPLVEVVDHPAQYVDRELRVEGTLTQGSIRFREEPCEWRFRIERQDRGLPVRYAQCIVPDTFRDGVNLTVVVQGKLGSDGTFVADQIVPRCPSKYEMRERQRNGEHMPHPPALPPPSPEQASAAP
jgi:cytochrome c-type biogenesis protein CcmE